MTLSDNRSKRRKVARESALDCGQPDAKGSSLYHCNCCRRDISRTVRIKCAVCPDFDLCLDCFSVGVEVSPHKSHHAYRVVDNLSFPLFHPDWGADEELLLLEAIEIFGLGNWAAVAEHMGFSKTADMCKTHWYQIYIDVPTCPLPFPAPEMGRIDPAKLVQDAKSKAITNKAASEPHRRKRGRQPSHAHAAGDERPANNGEGNDIPPTAPAHSGVTGAPEPRAPEEQKDAAPENAGGEPTDRGPKRPRLAKEPSSAVEEGTPARVQVGGRTMHTTSAAQGGPGTGPGGKRDVEGGKEPKTGGKAPAAGADAQAKMGSEVYTLTGYNTKRNEFDPEFDNDAELLIADLEFHDDDTEEEIADKLRMIEIYNKRLDERERRRDFILQHQLLNIKSTQAQEKRKTGLEREIHASLRVLARYQNPEEQEALAESMLVERRLRQRIQELKECRRSGIRTLSEAESYLEDQRKKLADDCAVLSSAASAHLLRIPHTSNVRAEPVQSFIPEHGLPTALAPVLTVRSGVAALDSWRTRRGFPLDLRCLPGTQLLGQQERELCSRARLLPPHYLLAKDSLIREYINNGHISKSEVRDYFRLEGSKAAKVHELLVSCGWINSGLPAGMDRPVSRHTPSMAGGSVVKQERKAGGEANQQTVSSKQAVTGEGRQHQPGIKVEHTH